MSAEHGTYKKIERKWLIVMNSLFIGAFRLTLFLLWTALLAPLQAVVLALRIGWVERLPMLYHRGCARIVGIDIVVRGAMCVNRPVLFVSNHSSYLDVTTLGSVIPGCFVAKSEVMTWPLFGWLSKLQRSVFIVRKARTGVDLQRDALGSRLEAGDNLILFPEGTSSDGNRTLPFKTSLFAVAAFRPGGRPLTVQPVSVAATRLDGIPMGVFNRPLYAWYGDMDLAPHLWSAFRCGRITVEIEFHPPVTAEGFHSRKELSGHCWRAIANGVARSVTGRTASGPGGEG